MLEIVIAEIKDVPTKLPRFMEKDPSVSLVYFLIELPLVTFNQDQPVNVQREHDRIILWLRDNVGVPGTDWHWNTLYVNRFSISYIGLKPVDALAFKLRYEGTISVR